MTPAKKPPPPWLDLTTPRSDRARTQQCPRCRSPVLRALVGHVAGLDIRADPLPLDPAAELAAMLAGRLTFCLNLRAWAPPRLLTRGHEHIAAGRCAHTVIAEHQCATRQTPEMPPPAPAAETGQLF